MKVIIFLILQTLIFTLKELQFEINCVGSRSIFLNSSENEYIILVGDGVYNPHSTHLIRVNTKNDELISDKKIFSEDIYYYKELRNGVNAYMFAKSILIENDGHNNTIKFDYYYNDYVFGDNSILISQNEFLSNYNIILYLIKEPYINITKRIYIEKGAKTRNHKLIALKDCFVFILPEENNNYILKILDLDLNTINSINISYSSISNIIFTEISKNKKQNAFLICIRFYKSTSECRIIEYENSNLVLGEIYQIFSMPGYDSDRFSIKAIDENIIGCYYLHYFTILEYKNKQLFYYKNIKEIPISTNNLFLSQEMFMIHKGIALISQSLWTLTLNYYSSMCDSKRIFVFPNKLSELPIESFIIQVLMS